MVTLSSIEIAKTLGFYWLNWIFNGGVCKKVENTKVVFSGRIAFFPLAIVKKNLSTILLIAIFLLAQMTGANETSIPTTEIDANSNEEISEKHCPCVAISCAVAFVIAVAIIIYSIRSITGFMSRNNNDTNKSTGVALTSGDNQTPQAPLVRRSRLQRFKHLAFKYKFQIITFTTLLILLIILPIFLFHICNYIYSIWNM